MKNFKLKNNITIRVTDEIFSAIRSSHYKERYAKKRDAKHQLVHYHAFDTENSDGENLIKDHSSLPDEIVIFNDMQGALYDALATLAIEDQLLLFNLYVQGESLRSIADKKHSNPMAIRRHREKLFKQLAILLVKYEIK